MKIGKGTPQEPGIYACRQWYGWRILEWTGMSLAGATVPATSFAH